MYACQQFYCNDLCAASYLSCLVYSALLLTRLHAVQLAVQLAAWHCDLSILVQHYIDNPVSIVFEYYNPFDYYEL